MILLGSIERTELQAVFDWWLSPERRVFERGQSSPGQGSKVSWESFTFVDEESREESANKVEKTTDEPQMNSFCCEKNNLVVKHAFFRRLHQCKKSVTVPRHPLNLRSHPPTTLAQVTRYFLSTWRQCTHQTSPPLFPHMCCGITSSDKRKLPSVRRTLQRLFSSTSSSGQTEIQVRCCHRPRIPTTLTANAQITDAAVTAQANMAAGAYLANAIGGQWPDAYMKGLTCGASGWWHETVSGYLITACVAFSVPVHLFLRLSVGDDDSSTGWHHVPGGGTADYLFSFHTTDNETIITPSQRIKVEYALYSLSPLPFWLDDADQSLGRGRAG